MIYAELSPLAGGLYNLEVAPAPEVSEPASQFYQEGPPGLRTVSGFFRSYEDLKAGLAGALGSVALDLAPDQRKTWLKTYVVKPTTLVAAAVWCFVRYELPALI